MRVLGLHAEPEPPLVLAHLVARCLPQSIACARACEVALCILSAALGVVAEANWSALRSPRVAQRRLPCPSWAFGTIPKPLQKSTVSSKDSGPCQTCWASETTPQKSTISSIAAHTTIQLLGPCQTPGHLRRFLNLFRNPRFLVSLLTQRFNFWAHATLLGICHDS